MVAHKRKKGGIVTPQNTRIKEGKALRTGVTTGSCATGAAKAAATALLSGQTPPTIRMKTPGGEEVFPSL
ncbi:MAG TPA: hypothetical protein DEP42_03840, partial [Ruminococcaceae bacterium]|nr:hypothetical protein [Oscillospiraceae bacterium]